MNEANLHALIKDCIVTTNLIDQLNKLTMVTGNCSYYPKDYTGIFTIIDLLNVDEELEPEMEAAFNSIRTQCSELPLDQQSEKVTIAFTEIIAQHSQLISA